MARRNLIKRNLIKGTLAVGTPQDRPAWLRHTDGENHRLVLAAMLVVVSLHYTMPGRFVVQPSWVAPSVELLIVVLLSIFHPRNTAHASPRVRALAQVQFVVMAVWNTVSLVLLVHAVTDGSHITAGALLGGGLSIWIDNVIVFSLWYWDFDRGGPAARSRGEDDQPDLLFPQMTDEHLARDWEPTYFDYFYVSFTNSTAFSPTDTMPLSRWVKALFTVQSLTALVTVTLVAARAVNILPR